MLGPQQAMQHVQQKGLTTPTAVSNPPCKNATISNNSMMEEGHLTNLQAPSGGFVVVSTRERLPKLLQQRFRSRCSSLHAITDV